MDIFFNCGQTAAVLKVTVSVQKATQITRLLILKAYRLSE